MSVEIVWSRANISIFLMILLVDVFIENWRDEMFNILFKIFKILSKRYVINLLNFSQNISRRSIECPDGQHTSYIPLKPWKIYT